MYIITKIRLHSLMDDQVNIEIITNQIRITSWIIYVCIFNNMYIIVILQLLENLLIHHN